MAKNGYRIFDSDTHVGPLMNVLDPFMTDAERGKLAGWSEFKAVNKKGDITYNRGQRRYRRKLGTAKADANRVSPAWRKNAKCRRWWMPMPPSASRTWILKAWM
jgi:hypothetical protein